MIQNIEGIEGHRVTGVSLPDSHAASLSVEATGVRIFFLLPEASHTYGNHRKLPFYTNGLN